jgi:NNP family nitrate/nitrite transporter-like MFS transporter
MTPLLLFGMACLGVGNGSVFQLVPQRFRDQIGVATGVVGAIGGLGGFALPILLGNIKQSSGSFAAGFATLALAALAGLILLRVLAALARGWRLSWRPTSSETLAAEAA